ncbi:MAG TPA: hypothetical protein VFB80_04505 [Pirellulaceae bacterium]|nr:hypothetical protein [Pirellulaceae bacterium]
MTDTIRRISWRDLFPWLILLRTFRIAISPPLLALATAAVLIAPLGWRLAGLVFQPKFESGTTNLPVYQAAGENSFIAQWTPPAVREYLPGAQTAFLEAYQQLAEPLARLFRMRITLREMAYYAFGFLWTLALWSFPGAVISRHAVVNLAAESPPGIVETARFAARRWHWYVLAPLYPLVPVLIVALGIAILGLPIQFAPGAGSILAVLAWIFVAIASLGVLWLFGGLLFGFPLMWPTISAERDGDAFEAFSRSYSYVYGKPLHYFFYVVVAALFGALCWAVVSGAATLLQEFGFWALAWGGTAAKVEPLRFAALQFALGLPAPPNQGWAFSLGTVLIGLVLCVIHGVVAGFRFTYFFTVASAIYLLLRQDVDEKEMDEVFIST